MTRSATGRSAPGGLSIAASSVNVVRRSFTGFALRRHDGRFREENLPMSAARALVQASLVGEAIDAGPAAVFVADDQLRLIAVNAYACHLLGYTREELLELRVSDLSANGGEPRHYEHLTSGKGGSG